MADITTRRSALSDLAIAVPAAHGAGITLQQQQPCIMLNLRGIADTALKDAVQRTCGCHLPTAPISTSAGSSGKILRLAPGEWLLVADDDTSWSENMMIPGATLTDVSHGRVAVRIDGNNSRDMLAKGCAIDLHPRQFPAGACIQTSVAKIGVILHRPRDDDGFILYAARSYAGSFWHWLTTSADEYGYHVVSPPAGSDEAHR